MNNYKTWDATEYIKDLTDRNKFAQNNDFKSCIVSGWEGLTEVITKMRSCKAFVAIDETAESYTRKIGAGFFETKVHTVFVLCRYKVLNEEDRLEQLNKCRELSREFQSKMIVDAEALGNALVYLDTEFQIREIGQVVLNGLTGLYFTFSFDRPQDLTLKESEWDNAYQTYGC